MIARAFALVVGVLFAAVAHATLVPLLSLAELRAHSDVVVRGVVDDTDARWLEGQRKIATFVTVRVDETLAGALSGDERGAQKVVLGVPGGVVGDLGQRVAGAPEFKVGDDVVVFLGTGTGPGGARGIVGLWQGAWFTNQGGYLPRGKHDVTAHDLPALRRALVEVAR